MAKFLPKNYKISYKFYLLTLVFKPKKEEKEIEIEIEIEMGQLERTLEVFLIERIVGHGYLMMVAYTCMRENLVPQ